MQIVAQLQKHAGTLCDKSSAVEQKMKNGWSLKMENN